MLEDPARYDALLPALQRQLRDEFTWSGRAGELLDIVFPLVTRRDRAQSGMRILVLSEGSPESVYSGSGTVRSVVTALRASQHPSHRRRRALRAEAGACGRRVLRPGRRRWG